MQLLIFHQDQKKSVWFKKQRYHCVYEYPKETLSTETQGESTNTWESTSYSGKFIFFFP